MMRADHKMLGTNSYEGLGELFVKRGRAVAVRVFGGAGRGAGVLAPDCGLGVYEQLEGKFTTG